jgi:taurine dioxygenase
MAIQTRKMEDGFALEVVGVRLWETQSPETIREIRELWADRGVLVFRRQALAEAELAGFSGRFGELERVVRTDWASKDVPEVGIISNLQTSSGEAAGGLGDGEVKWHSDQSYVESPATGCALYAAELPSEGGDTLWANLADAYAALPLRLKQAVEGRKGVFSYAERLAGYRAEDQGTSEIRARTPDVVHDLVQRHPRTGKTSLYFDPTTTVDILGMAHDDAQALIADLAEFSTQQRFVYRHRWQIGDVVMWDNAFLLHRREPFSPAQRRLMKRTTVALPAEFHIVPKGAPAAMAH